MEEDHADLLARSPRNGDPADSLARSKPQILPTISDWFYYRGSFSAWSKVPSEVSDEGGSVASKWMAQGVKVYDLDRDLEAGTSFLKFLEQMPILADLTMPTRTQQSLATH